MGNSATVLALIVITHVDVFLVTPLHINWLNILALLYDCRNQQAVTRRMDFFSVGLMTSTLSKSARTIALSTQ
jgi:hypothetical protein